MKEDIGVRSECGRLRSVIVCEPGLAHMRVTPSNCHEMLFDDVLWVDKALSDHRAFQGVLRSAGVEVLELHQLLENILHNNDEAKKWLLSCFVNPLTHGPMHEELFEILASFDPARLVRHLIGGITKGELGQPLMSLWRENHDENDFLLDPLPNSIFTRDSSAWLYHGVSLNPMFYPVRRFEKFLLQAVYRFHPRFEDRHFSYFFGDDNVAYGSHISLEGGDMMPLGKGVVMIGVSQRTNIRSVEGLASRIFSADSEVERIIAVLMPKMRSAMHLDTIFTVCSRDVITLYPDMLDQLTLVSLYRSEKEPSGFSIKKETKGLLEVYQEAMQLKKLHIAPTGGDIFQREREQWNDANNVVCIDEGRVIAYASNTATIAKMKEYNIEVIEIDGSELGRARGGSHCMTCPVWRDAL